MISSLISVSLPPASSIASSIYYHLDRTILIRVQPSSKPIQDIPALKYPPSAAASQMPFHTVFSFIQTRSGKVSMLYVVFVYAAMDIR